MSEQPSDLDLVEIANEVRRWLRKHGASPADAEDIVQEAILVYLQRRKKGSIADVGAFMRGVALNQLRAAQRRRQKFAKP